jgi:hypothetical protein
MYIYIYIYIHIYIYIYIYMCVCVCVSRGKIIYGVVRALYCTQYHSTGTGNVLLLRPPASTAYNRLLYSNALLYRTGTGTGNGQLAITVW